ncbi:chromosome segregation protein [Gallibacterium anatis]|uniref:Chromosome segregation protein n=1 Tax=Gallibacterium anatis TaxID=750 RepID=A0A377H6Z4_9PAST|nr:hypothetical protein [Gallibacterium anatis]KGQ57346.1 hypothetical protein IE01_05280 [Gallibacterium anatis DSM 16844 = F 149]STO37857.1 chromosome segregation protein [Gallibacterium anatis]
MRKSIKFSLLALCISNVIAVNTVFAAEQNQEKSPSPTLSKQQLIAEINQLNKEISAKEKTAVALNNQIKDLQSKITKAKQDLQSKIKERDALTNSLQASSKEKAQLEGQIKSLTAQLADLQKKIDPKVVELVKQKNTAETQLKKVNADVSSKTNQLNQLTAQIKQSTTKVEQLKAQIKPLETQISGLNAQVKQQQDKLTKIAAERKAVTTKIAEYTKNQEWVKQYELDSDGVRWRDLYFDRDFDRDNVSFSKSNFAKTSGNKMPKHVEVITDELGNRELSEFSVELSGFYTPTLPLSQYKANPSKINEVLIGSEQPENKGKAVGKAFFVNQNYSSYVAWRPVMLEKYEPERIQALVDDDKDKVDYVARTDYQKGVDIKLQAQQRYESVKAKTPQITYRGYMLNVGGKSGDITLTADLDKNVVNGTVTNRIVNPLQDRRDLLLKNGQISVDRDGITFRGTLGKAIIPVGNNPDNLPFRNANFSGTFAGKNMEEVVGKISGLPNEASSVFGGTQVTK